MRTLPKQIDLVDVPPHVASWCVAKIPGFVLAVLGRWQRNHGELPERFTLVMCPQVEINALGGLPREVTELTDPRLRCRHFTGCNRPYFSVLFLGDQAEDWRARIQAFLPWSEGYAVELTEDAVRLCLRGATEDVAERDAREGRSRSRLRELLASGELVSILA